MNNDHGNSDAKNSIGSKRKNIDQVARATDTKVQFFEVLYTTNFNYRELATSRPNPSSQSFTEKA